ncbi:MAG: 5'/3'-nucleotidase SurE [Acidimicrobiia bacterium]
MRVLVTNDDGIASPGLHALARDLETRGHDVLVVAPREDMSGASAAIGRLPENDLVGVTTVEIAGVTEPGRAIDGPPGLAVIAAMFGAFGDTPEVVVSGINSGLNTGPLVLHSGTVGAALTAQNFGASAIAVSLQASDPWRWDTACAFAGDLVAWLGDRAPNRTMLSLNVPARSLDDVKGLRWCRLGTSGSVRVAVGDGHRGLQFEFQARDSDADDPAAPFGELAVDAEVGDDSSDEELVHAGWATVTALRGVTEDRLDVEHPLPTLVERHVAAGPLAGDAEVGAAGRAS